MKDKIGVGIITCNREDFFKKCINSIPEADEIVVINDGLPYSESSYPSKVKHLIQHSKNKCVGISKNEAMRHLVQQDCDHIFIVEDDMLIINPEVYTKYIKTAKKTGIFHLNFGYHGIANMHEGKPRPRQIVDYGDGVELALNPHCVGAFSYYLKGIIKHIGYIDERFQNCWDHVEHTYRIIKSNLHPPFWWFADVADSYNYINEQATPEQSSAIRKSEDWKRNFREGAEWYKYKHGAYPTNTPDTPPQKVLEVLEMIRKNYSRT